MPAASGSGASASQLLSDLPPVEARVTVAGPSTRAEPRAQSSPDTIITSSSSTAVLNLVVLNSSHEFINLLYKVDKVLLYMYL